MRGSPSSPPPLFPVRASLVAEREKNAAKREKHAAEKEKHAAEKGSWEKITSFPRRTSLYSFSRILIFTSFRIMLTRSNTRVIKFKSNHHFIFEI